MRKLLVLALVMAFGFAFPIACGGSDIESSEGTEEVVEDIGIPDWFVNTPSEPGLAFYGVGTGVFKQAGMMQSAMDQADANARAQIASTMQTTIQSCVQRYMRTILTNEGDLSEEMFAQTAQRAITNLEISGAEIKRRDFSNLQEDGSRVCYALCRIGFDSVADSMYDATREAVAQVQENATVAFDELSALLNEEQDKAGGKVPYVEPEEATTAQ